jgi:hypothetical protein
MRNANQKTLNSGIYARLQSMQMSESDRQGAVTALEQAEQIAGAILWISEKFSEIGQVFLRPSLKH